ncbi:hypothetical protein GCM10010149_21730 [Nonomuraea roseoviolacea subsp. roseoviolacea]
MERRPSRTLPSRRVRARGRAEPLPSTKVGAGHDFGSLRPAHRSRESGAMNHRRFLETTDNRGRTRLLKDWIAS